MSKAKNSKKEDKKKIVNNFQINEKDTGSAEVQIGLLTKEIKDLTEHLRVHIHDHSSRRGLLKKVSLRRKFLKYLQADSPQRYEKVVKKIKK
ncbi:MAG: 30S ribosomal protein S15 [Patescibacteria group bacterium]|jgi:small subunit ribosomal protein S15|nr:30S ribosomal protein S15 [Patescibacteria group bacterium]MDD5172938.1 30S ribosomal protein S15 [Patescibacteria group bacterium]